MKKRLDEEVTEPDRTYLALAAYNVGLMHLRDAQKLAKRRDLDPHDWSDVREVLPLLADKRYYPQLKYGYARGTEPVRYVRRIRDYRDVILRKAP
jgi:membrane-bound lytic murein transglycosylase F